MFINTIEKLINSSLQKEYAGKKISFEDGTVYHKGGIYTITDVQFDVEENYGGAQYFLCVDCVDDEGTEYTFNIYSDSELVFI